MSISICRRYIDDFQPQNDKIQRSKPTEQRLYTLHHYKVPMSHNGKNEALPGLPESHDLTTRDSKMHTCIFLSSISEATTSGGDVIFSISTGDESLYKYGLCVSFSLLCFCWMELVVCIRLLGDMLLRLRILIMRSRWRYRDDFRDADCDL